jgi:dTDP-4-dehydrorhamnose 3,5-epimerase
MFTRIFCKKELEQIGHMRDIAQVNHSLTEKAGTIRGMHYQKPPKAEIKLVRCIKGSVYDVIVDIRKNSPTFLKWHGEKLSGQNMLTIYIPEGFAHGFQTLSPQSELIYFHTEFYDPLFEDGIRHDDPRIGVKWPLNVAEISNRDNEFAMLAKNFTGIVT